MGYFEMMYRARIIVTSNPSGWEGGNREHIARLISIVVVNFFEQISD